MQLIITVVATPGRSLREIITHDPKLVDFELYVAAHKDVERSKGWSKIHSSSANGAINVEWLAHSNLLLCRIVTRGDSKPARIAGYLIDYLLSRHRRRIVHLHVSGC